MPLFSFGLLAHPQTVGAEPTQTASPQEQDDATAQNLGDKEVSAEAAPRPADMPLSPLPTIPRLEPSAPRPEALAAIDGILERISGEDPLIRERASRELLEGKSDWVSGLARRIDRIAERADRAAMKPLLEEMRRDARRGLSKGDPTPDYLDVALAQPRPDSQSWRDLVQILAVSRMLTALETTEAVRELVRIYVRFGEFMRIDTQRQLESLGDRSIAGLMEAKRHQAPKISRWAARQLDLRGKAIAHEAVRTDDPEALTDILVALGRTRDPDSARLLISFSGSERSQIRLAARQGIVLLGEVAAWQLRDAFLNTTGRQPPREWTWKRTARELFTEYDRLRLAEVFHLFEEARRAEKAGDLESMKKGYDAVLAASPLFEQRHEMSEGYLRFALEFADTPKRADEVIGALRRAERVADDDQLRARADSLRFTIEAEQLSRRGLLDRGLADKAIALDSENERARDFITSPDPTQQHWSPLARYSVAGAIALLALLGAAWVLFTARPAVVRKTMED